MIFGEIIIKWLKENQIYQAARRNELRNSSGF